MSTASRKLQRSVGKPLGAQLYLSPASGSVTNGNTVVVTIRENSYTDAVNTVQANLTYPTNRLSFQSIDTSASNFTTTVQSNGGSGTVQVGVGLLGNSLTGDQLVATMTFTAISAGSASIQFDTGSGIARASDSTDICQQKKGATYTIS